MLIQQVVGEILGGHRDGQGFTRLSGVKKFRMGFDVTDLALEILIAGIKRRDPHLDRQALLQEIQRCLWDGPSKVLGASFRD